MYGGRRIKAAMKLDEQIKEQTLEVNSNKILPSALCAAAELARAISNSYAEIAGE